MSNKSSSSTQQGGVYSKYGFFRSNTGFTLNYNETGGSMKLKKGTKILLYLTACALNNKNSKKDITEEQGRRLLSLAHRHTTGALTAIAVESNESHKETLSREQIKKWTSVKAAAVKRRVLFDMERERLLKIAEKEGIWYCPLKGIILQDLYPSYEMREMSDNDILFDEKKRDKLKEIMLSEGYALEDHGVTNHDLYTKAPVYNFEFHTKLFMHTFSTRFTGYYENVKEKLLKDEGNDFGYHFTDEDFYIYITAHAYKHYKEGGLGIRALADSYIYNLKKNDLDRKYISAECKKLGIDSFEKLTRRVAFKLFEDPGKTYANVAALTDKEKEFLSYISFTGSYCTKEDFIKSRIKRSGSKGRYVFRRLVPDINYYKEAHPFLYKNRIFIPAFLVYRAGKVLVNDRNTIVKELNILKKSDKNI